MRGPTSSSATTEFRDNHGRWHEVDLLVLGRRRLHLVELKYYSGVLRGDDHTWLRAGKRAEDSPLKLARRKAQYLASRLKEQLVEWARKQGVKIPDLREGVPFVQESVFLHHPNLVSELSEHSAQGIYGLEHYENRSHLPSIATLLTERPHDRQLTTATHERLLPILMEQLGLSPRRERTAGSWVIEESMLSEGEGWQDWRAYHSVTQTQHGRIRFQVPPPGAGAAQTGGLVLQEKRVGRRTWPEWLDGIELGSPDDAQAVADWQLSSQHLDEDSGMLFAGPEAERRYGRVHYRDLMAVFTADPEVVVLHGRLEIGTVDPMLLMRKVDGPRLITLAGRPWEVTYIDWKRHKAFVEPAKAAAVTRWQGMPQAQSYELSDAIRRVLLGDEPADVRQTRRAQEHLASLREEFADCVHPETTTVVPDGARTRWWTWAGARANAVLVAALDSVEPEILGDSIAYDNLQIGLRSDVTAAQLTAAKGAVRESFAGLESVVPLIDERAVRKLKFSEMLPPEMAIATLAARGADHAGAQLTMARQVTGPCG